ncbi:MAG: amidohydrolase family protein, partial [Chloroflexota bacterium]
IATEGGAKALGLADQIGDLSVGKQADLIMLDRSGIGWQPFSANDPFTALVYSIHGLQVTDTMVAGHWLLRDQQWTTLDYPTAAYQLNESAKQLLKLRDHPTK